MGIEMELEYLINYATVISEKILVTIVIFYFILNMITSLVRFNLVSLYCYVTGLVFYLRCLSRLRIEDSKYVDPEDIKNLDMQSNILGVCGPCSGLIYKNTKHCTTCNKCFQDSHHCIFLNNCVHDMNKDDFLFYMVFLLVGNLFNGISLNYLNHIINFIVTIYLCMNVYRRLSRRYKKENPADIIRKKVFTDDTPSIRKNNILEDINISIQDSDEIQDKMPFLRTRKLKFGSNFESFKS